MSNFEIFSCHSNMLNAIRSPIEQNFLIDLYCSPNFFAIDYVKIFYWFSGKSFIVIALLMALVGWVLLHTMIQLIKKVLTPNIIAIKKRLTLSPFIVAVLILTPLSHASLILEDSNIVIESDFYNIQYAYLLGNIFMIVGLAAPLLVLINGKSIRVPYYAIYVCLFFTMAGFFFLYLWAIVGIMHWSMPVIHFLTFGLFVYMSFWAKNKDSDYERMIAESEGLINELGSVVENDFKEDNEENFAEFENNSYLRGGEHGGYDRIEYSDFENRIEDRLENETPRQSQEATERSQEIPIAPVINSAKKNDLINKLKSDPDRSLLLINKLLDHLEDPDHSILERIFYLPINAFMLVAVPHSSNPLMNTNFKYGVLSIAAALMVLIQFPKMHWTATLGFIVGLATIFVLTTIFVKSNSFILNFFDIISFIQVLWVVNFLELAMTDMFFFFEFYFSVNSAVIQGFVISFKRVSVLFLVAFFLHKNNEPQIAIFNFYTWPVFGLLVNFAVWTIQGLIQDSEKKMRLFATTFNPETDFFDLPGLAFLKWLFLFTVIMYTVKAFYYLEVGNEPDKRTAKIFLSVYVTFTVLTLFFIFAF